MKTKIIGQSFLSVNDVSSASTEKLEIDLNSKNAIKNCRAYLEKKVSNSTQKIYGINTGFGSLCNVAIADDEIEKLQTNLVLSHACGLGELVPLEIVQLMLSLKIKNFCYGHSGVSIELVEKLIYFKNNNILPVVFQQGSLGASGDLAPLAHLSLPLLGEGEVFHNGIRKKTSDLFNELKISPLKLKSKEGLALLNGTQFMAAYGVWAAAKMEHLFEWANIITALSLDAFDGRTDAFNKNIHQVRPHEGQLKVAETILSHLENSEIAGLTKEQVQDPYSFRCVPQVHGATWDALQQFKKVIETEINSVSDNPLIFPDEDLIVSGGNFHGQPLALQLDFLAIAASELANISERRTYLLISGQRTLPAFLVKNPGLESGLMIAQYTAASIVSQNKQLCSPASVDSIVSSNGQEDHVSMGANAATKLYKVIENVEKVLAIEWLCACQALEFKRPLKTSPFLEEKLAAFRKEVSFMESDRIIHDDMMKAIDFLRKPIND